jgi:excisionase family DNA binding protein
VSDLARALLDDLAGDPIALERLRELVGYRDDAVCSAPAPAYTVATLAAELGRTERSIRAAIARGELEAVKRGRGYVISADAVAEWARAPIPRSQAPVRSRNSRRRPVPGPAARALRRSR